MSRSEEREFLSELLSRMTLEEKVHQLASFFPNGDNKLCIPHMQAGECLHGVMADSATSFPQAIALGATWDPALVERVAEVIAREARALGIHHCYTPMLGVVRDPRWGRTEESYGEDPYHVSKIGAGFIHGLQGRGARRFDSDHVIATAKHFVADGEPTAGLNGAAMDLSERTLHEVFLPPFREAVEEAAVGSIMPAHHPLNGVPCHANTWILRDILRDRYGFDGVIVSDNGDIRCLHTLLEVADSHSGAAHAALTAGVDVELAWLTGWNASRYYGPALVEAVESGQIPEELVDQAAGNHLKMKLRLGLFESGLPVPEKQESRETNADDWSLSQEHIHYASSKYAEQSPKDCATPREGWQHILSDPSHDALALEAARKSITLLKNDQALLPLDRDTIRRVAVIGPNADAQVLGGYSTRQPRRVVTPLAGIRAFVGDTIEVVHAEGCSLGADLERHEINAATKAAQEADVAVVCVGGNELTTRENEDRDDLALVGHQHRLIREVVETGTPVVLLLIHGRPNSIQWEANHVPAILDCWYLGQEGGTAIAEALFGAINPGGKLPVTVPRNVGQVPCYYNRLPGGREGKYFNSPSRPLFAFGHGLSYTEFLYDELNIETEPGEIPLSITARITNTGTRRGDEVAQLYLHFTGSRLTRPVKELKGFERVSLDPGESRVVRFELGERELSSYDDRTHDWTVESAKIEIMMGSSSEDIRLRTETQIEP